MTSFLLQSEPSAEEAQFGEWPHVCAVLKKEQIGSVSQAQKNFGLILV